MIYKLGKVFKKKNDEKLDIKIIEYDSSQDDYYSLIKKYREQGYSQVIVSSKLMVNILSEYFLIRKCKIIDIEMLEEDDVLDENIKNILTKVNGDRAYFSVLLDEIYYLVEENSIDLKKIEFSWRENGETTSVFILLNGIIGISDNKYVDEIEHLQKFISESFK